MDITNHLENPKVKRELGTGGQKIVKNLQGAISITEKEIGVLLEMEAAVASPNAKREDLVVQFVAQLRELPHFKNDEKKATEYVESLFKMDEVGTPKFLDTIEKLQLFIEKCTKDLEALDEKYNVEKTPQQKVKESEPVRTEPALAE